MSFADRVVANLLDDELSETLTLTGPLREMTADTLQTLSSGHLRSWVWALLEVAQERPNAAQAAADNLLDNLEPVLAEAAKMLRWQH